MSPIFHDYPELWRSGRMVAVLLAEAKTAAAETRAAEGLGEEEEGEGEEEEEEKEKRITYKVHV